MKSFKQYIKEETMPFAVTASGSININDPAVLDGLNSQLAGVTSGKFVTPYIAFERVQKALANFLIFPKRPTFFEGDSGVFVHTINQFGDKMGMTNDGEVVNKDDMTYSLYFEYRQSDCGMFNIYAEIVDQEELDELLADVEDELNDEGEEEEDSEEELNESSIIDNHRNMISYHKKMEDKHGAIRLDSSHGDAAFEHKNAAEAHQTAIDRYKKDPEGIDYKMAARGAEKLTKKAKDSSEYLYMKEQTTPSSFGKQTPYTYGIGTQTTPRDSGEKLVPRTDNDRFVPGTIDSKPKMRYKDTENSDEKEFVPEEKFTNRAPSVNPYGNLDAAKKEMNKPKSVPSRGTKDLDQMNRDEDGNTVVESDDWFFDDKKKKNSDDVTSMERPANRKSSGYTYRHKTSGKEITKDTKGKPSSEWKRLKEEQVDEACWKGYRKKIDNRKVKVPASGRFDEETQIDEGIKEKVGGMIRRAKSKNILQSRRDYAWDKAGEKFSAGKSKQGERYIEWAKKDKKKNPFSPFDPGPLEETQIDEISRDLASRYIKKAKESTKDTYYGSDAPTMGKRNKGIDLALMKKWGDKKYGLPEPKVKATNEESVQIDEVSKKTLASYIKKASHDVATKSAATGRYAERANKEEDNRKKNQDYSGYQQGRKDNAFADKMFKKSWKRREGIAKAADKLSKD